MMQKSSRRSKVIENAAAGSSDCVVAGALARQCQLLAHAPQAAEVLTPEIAIPY